MPYTSFDTDQATDSKVDTSVPPSTPLPQQILMVDTSNVIHLEYKQTEEIKVALRFKVLSYPQSN